MIFPALAGFQRVSPWSNSMRVTHHETHRETVPGESLLRMDADVSDGSRVISLGQKEFLINLECVTSRSLWGWGRNFGSTNVVAGTSGDPLHRPAVGKQRPSGIPHVALALYYDHSAGAAGLFACA